MFQINRNKLKTDLPLITDNYMNILFDEEPILFSGTNKYGNLILGSFVDEDDSALFYRFFHTIIDEKTYIAFLNKKITYLEILKKEDLSIYVVDKSYENTILNIYPIEISEIPSEYIPLENSFCPEIEKKYSLHFILSLKGKLADLNLAIPVEISNIQTAFTRLLESSTKPLKNLSLSPQIYQAAYNEGSFRLNFNLNFNDSNLFPADESLISKYVTKYLEYCVSFIHDEANAIFKDLKITATNFELLKNDFKMIYESLQAKLPDNYEDLIKNELALSVTNFDKITESIGNNFTGIELINKTPDKEYPIGFVDYNYKSVLAETLHILEEAHLTYEDKEPFVYSVCIYHLNTKTRTGNAYIYNLGSDKEMSQPKIKITGEESLEGSKFTESLHLNKWIEVKALALRVGNKFQRLTIIYEDDERKKVETSQTSLL